MVPRIGTRPRVPKGFDDIERRSDCGNYARFFSLDLHFEFKLFSWFLVLGFRLWAFGSGLGSLGECGAVLNP